MVDAPLPPPEEGRAENLLFLKKKKKNLDKKRFSLPLGPKRAWRVMDGPTPDHTLLPLSPADSSGRFESVIKGPTHAPSAKLWNQVSVAPHTQTPLWSDRVLQPLLHCAQERRWVETNLGSARPELGKLPFKRLTQKCIFGCIRP